VYQLTRMIARTGISLLAVMILMLWQTATTHAEGSKELTDPADGGYRPYLLYDAIGTVGGVPNISIIKVYAEDGEVLNLGSSANGKGAGVINYRSPGGVAGTCPVTGVIGRILSRVQENAGPLPAPDGYTPCVVDVNQTGVWEVTFISPNPVAGTANNPPTVLVANDAWVIDVDPDTDDPAQPDTVRWIRAWDVTVTDGGVRVPGRVYADHLPLNMGNNLPGQVFNSVVYIFTEDGYLYEVNMNGIDAFGFQFLSNNKGFQQGGEPIFRSLQLTGNNNTQGIPAGFSLHSPNLPDTLDDKTHKIFFNYPDFPTFNLLNSAPVISPSGPITFQTPPIAPPVPTELTFIGEEGTPNNAGTAPLEGTFTFFPNGIGTYTIKLDVNRDGIYGNANDRIIIGYADTPEQQIVPWDGLDRNGVPVPAGPVGYDAQIELYAGEVHFPFIDPENNAEGIIIERIIDPDSTDNEPPVGIAFYNDLYNFREGGEYDYSICADADEGLYPPPPPAANVFFGCYGAPLDAREAIGGVDSVALGGVHAWTGGPNEGFGNIRGMDTWSNYPSDAVVVEDLVFLRQADLAVDKIHTTNPVVPGGSIEFKITVSNYVGPSDAFDSTFFDQFPPEFQNITWTCEGFDGGVCETPSGTGSILEAAPVVIDLPIGAYVVFTFNATVDPNLPAGTTITNQATVYRPNDVTDPTDPDRVGAGNNTDPDEIVIQQAPPTSTPTETATEAPTNTPTETPNPLTPTATSTVDTSVTPTGTSSAPSNTPNGSETPTNTPNGSETPTNTPNGSETPPQPNTPQFSPTPTDIPPNPFINKSARPPFVKPGDEVVWTITVTNPDPSPLTNVQVIDNLPADLQLISVSATAGEVFFYGQTVEFNIETLNAGQVITITVVTRVRDTAVPPLVLRNLAILTVPGRPPITTTTSVTVVGGLPDTGESPYSALRFGIVGLAIIGVGVWGLHRVRKSA
jgi:uncharacterized repeat protein (TIGR01451 family)